MSSFIGRKAELQSLVQLAAMRRSAMVVIKGRRRIGKSRLAAEFGRDKQFLSFTGLAPINTLSAQDQRNHFTSQLATQCHLPTLHCPDWNDIFAHLEQMLDKKALNVILFDEISWMGSKDPSFLPKLKAWWDIAAQTRSNIILILCGSVSTWIEDNIIKSTAFFGRINLTITLKELSLADSYELLKTAGCHYSNYDVFKVLSVTGGVPWYLEQIITAQTADANLHRLCFEPDGLLVQEYDRIFHDLFGQYGEIYRQIVDALSEGMRTSAEIGQYLNYPRSGSLNKYLNALVISGFVSKHYSWNLKTAQPTKKYLYRLSDSYLRFYCKYIRPNLPKIEHGAYRHLSLNQLPGWDSLLGFQVENLLLNNRYLIQNILDIPPHDIVADNPYIQRKTARHRGCQLDYLIQTHNNNLYACEFKFKKRELSTEIINEVKEKMQRFSIPRGFGVSPILLHLGGVSDSVIDARYFYRIIDINDFLE